MRAEDTRQELIKFTHSKSNMMYHDILFDLDGTITASAEGIVNSVVYALEKCGFAVKNRNELYKFVGPPLGEMFAEYCGISKEAGKQMVNVYREYYSVHGIFENDIYEGIEELLANLKQSGRRVFLATSKPEIYANKILEHYKLLKYFDGVAGCELDGRRTYKAEVIADVIKRYGIENAVMVGDRCYDVSGAHEYGFPCIGVLYGYGSRAELEEAGAELIAETVAELGEILKR